jgi:hypothetical protein
MTDVEECRPPPIHADKQWHWLRSKGGSEPSGDEPFRWVTSSIFSVAHWWRAGDDHSELMSPARIGLHWEYLGPAEYAPKAADSEERATPPGPLPGQWEYRFSISDRVRVLEIAHETTDAEVKQAALHMLREITGKP